jgi:3-oxoacyl-[acyl-carrier-protein] synthase II
MTNKRRVVITGFGLVSPLGNTIEALSHHIFNGISGVKALQSPFSDQLDCKIAAQADFDPANYLSKNVYGVLDRTGQMALHASNEAIKHAQLTLSDELKPRTGVYLGTGMGGALSIEDGYISLFSQGNKRLKPFTVLMSMYNGPASAIALHHKTSGPNQTFTTACSSSTVSIGYAARDIRHGYADVALAGGTDAILSYGSIKAWEAIRTLADPDPENIGASCKPFSKNRDGLVIGEGAAVLVLESYEHAMSRGATIYAEIIGFGTANDGTHITIPSEAGQAATMQAALDDAAIDLQKIQYINAHGTGTLFNDAAETNAIKKVFAAHAYQLAVSSTKSMHGHLMGAAGALEAIITTLAVYNNKIPPTINLKDPDPVCDLDYVPNVARAVDRLDYAMSNSFAFGGTGASIILKKMN